LRSESGKRPIPRFAAATAFASMISAVTARSGFVRGPGFLFCIVVVVALSTLVYNRGAAWQQATPEISPIPQRHDVFDLRFPAEAEWLAAEPQPARDPTAAQAMPSLSQLPFAPQVHVPSSLRHSSDPGNLRRMMDIGVAQYASATEDRGRSKGASLVQTAALLGYPPARELIVRNYARSSAVRSTVPAEDAVRFAVDLVTAEAASETAEAAVALANYFLRRGDVLRFARHVVDAISDDERLQTRDKLAREFAVFGRVPGVCLGIQRVISGRDVIYQDECSEPLIDEVLNLARFSGQGINAEARLRAMRLLDEVTGTPTR
jgi:hypothetical protein